jgi:hypothetical protein
VAAGERGVGRGGVGRESHQNTYITIKVQKNVYIDTHSYSGMQTMYITIDREGGVKKIFV